MAKGNSTNNSISHGGAGYETSPEEESGWTIYFEDFINTNNYSFSSSDHHHHHDHDQTTYSVPADDAASSVAHRKLPDNYDVANAVDPRFSWEDDHVINIFSKRRKMIKELFVDHDDEALEDTATSPLNSPKVCNSTCFSRNQKHKENMIIPQVNNERREMGFVGIGSEYKELKKRGLCLVPLSMLPNYYMAQ